MMSSETEEFGWGRGEVKEGSVATAEPSPRASVEVIISRIQVWQSGLPFLHCSSPLSTSHHHHHPHCHLWQLSFTRTRSHPPISLPRFTCQSRAKRPFISTQARARARVTAQTQVAPPFWTLARTAAHARRPHASQKKTAQKGALPFVLPLLLQQHASQSSATVSEGASFASRRRA